MNDAILVINAGSSSIKFSLFPSEQRPTREDLFCEGEYAGLRHRARFTAKDGAGAPLVDAYLAEYATHEDALAALLRWLERHFPEQRLVAAGHRVVHGGMVYKAPVRIDASVIAELTRLVPLVSAVCLLSDFGLAGWCSLSLGARVPSAARIMPELAATALAATAPPIPV